MSLVNWVSIYSIYFKIDIKLVFYYVYLDKFKIFAITFALKLIMGK